MLYTEPRYTKNLEICVDTATDNAVPPTRIDVLTSISGVAFGETWERRTEAEFGDAVAHSISLDDLLQDKRISGRPTELADYRRLEEAKHLS